jgi:hypothetical protein
MSVFASVRFAFVVLMAIPLLAIGCSGSDGPKVRVEGNVTLDGNPLGAGLITFTQMEGNYRQTAGQIVNGKYSVDNVAPGKNQVLVSGGSGSGGGAVDSAKMQELGRKMQNMGRMHRTDPQGAARLRAEMMRAEGMGNPGAGLEKTAGNDQVVEISGDRNQTVDVSLETVRARK